MTDPRFLPHFDDENRTWHIVDGETKELVRSECRDIIRRFQSEGAATTAADRLNRDGGYQTVSLSKALDKVVMQAKAGQRLVKSFRQRRDLPAEVVFHFEPSGRPAQPVASMDAIERGLLTPIPDGLFGADTAQTFIWAGERA